MGIINDIKKVYQPYMLRPILYKSVTKASIALALTLVWDRFFNPKKMFDLVRDAFFVVGIFFLAYVWFQYLRMDGVKVNYAPKPKKRKEKKGFLSKDIVDFADEKIISYDELEEDEQALSLIHI